MLHKAFVILEALSSSKENTISAISKTTNIPRSSVHRILKALAEEDVVTFNPQKGYVLTPKLISIGLKGIAQRDILEGAVPIMRIVAEKTQETISLSVISGQERVCIYRVEGSHPITRNIKIGDRGPLFRGSVGKIIASGLSEKEIDLMIQRYIESEKIQESEVEEVLQEINRVKDQGFATSFGERIENSASIGVPVKDNAGHTLAALTVSTVAERLDEENKQKYLELLLEAARQISDAL